MKSFFSFFSLLFFTNLFSQTEYNLFENKEDGKEEFIETKKLMGTWESTDSLKSTIQFQYFGNDFILRLSPDANHDQFSSYMFSLKDSTHLQSNQGVIIKWPPDDCYINLLSDSLLSVTYILFMSDTTVMNYRFVSK